MRPRANVGLDESTDNSFQKNDVAVAGLDQERRRSSRREIGATSERVGSGAIGEVVEAAAADVGNVDAEADLVLAVGVGGEVGPVEVVFGTAGICFCATPRGESRGWKIGGRHNFLVRNIIRVAVQT